MLDTDSWMTDDDFNETFLLGDDGSYVKFTAYDTCVQLKFHDGTNVVGWENCTNVDEHCDDLERLASQLIAWSNKLREMSSKNV